MYSNDQKFSRYLLVGQDFFTTTDSQFLMSNRERDKMLMAKYHENEKPRRDNRETLTRVFLFFFFPYFGFYIMFRLAKLTRVRMQWLTTTKKKHYWTSVNAEIIFVPVWSYICLIIYIGISDADDPGFNVIKRDVS